MITKPTVLILGAGASAHCGYPLGGDLVNRLCALRGKPELDNLPQDWTRNDAEKFLTRLSRSDHTSIDAFLEENLDQAPLGKFLIAREMKKLENIDHLFPPSDSGWYQDLFNKIFSEGPKFSENKIGIVTFNYDRSLEAYLHTRLQYKMSEIEATNILKELPIVHVYGILGEYPTFPYQTQCDVSDLLKISQQIQIVHEIKERDGNFCNPMFERAHQMLESAMNIYFLGFGFHRDNVRRFQFFMPESIKGKSLRATIRGLGLVEYQDLMKDLAEFGFSPTLLPLNQRNCNDFFQNVVHLE